MTTKITASAKASNDLPITMEEDSLPHYCSKCDERYGEDIKHEAMERDHRSHEKYLKALKLQQEPGWLWCLRLVFDPDFLFVYALFTFVLWALYQSSPLKQL